MTEDLKNGSIRLGDDIIVRKYLKEAFHSLEATNGTKIDTILEGAH